MSSERGVTTLLSADQVPVPSVSSVRVPIPSLASESAALAQETVTGIHRAEALCEVVGHHLVILHSYARAGRWNARFTANVGDAP